MWTHLIGFLIFAGLLIHTMYLLNYKWGGGRGGERGGEEGREEGETTHKINLNIDAT